MSKSSMSEYNHARYLRQREATIERTRRREIENPWGVLKSRASAWRKNPTHKNVYRLVHSAISAGFLVRPDHCESCGRPDIGCRDGRTILHAHHPNHDRPLLVEWVCARCHAGRDPQKWEPVECSVCGRVSRGRTGLHNHMKVHMN